MKLYDEFTVELARKMPWTIEAVDRAVTLLALAGASPVDVELWLGRIAQGQVTLRGAVRAVQLRRGAIERRRG